MTSVRSIALAALSRVLTYPREDYLCSIEECRQALAAICPESSKCVQEFAEQLSGKTLAEFEELYIRTFDLNPLCTLDIGWQLFGEEYNRGLFLVKLRRIMRCTGIQESTELPDHITHVLAMLSRMEEEDAGDFVAACVIPAITKIRDAVPEDNPYRVVIDALIRLFEAQFSYVLEEAVHG